MTMWSIYIKMSRARLILISAMSIIMFASCTINTNEIKPSAAVAPFTVGRRTTANARVLACSTKATACSTAACGTTA